jgi:RNA polymerase sigma-70 factor (sigma-E family)
VGGNDDDFREFVLLRRAGLLRSAHALTGDRATAEDLVQNALLKTYTSWGRVSRADDPYAYTQRILFTSFSRMRRRRRVAEDLGASAEPAAAGADDGEIADRDQLRRALDELPARYQAVLVLRFYEDFSVEKVAGILGCSTGTVKTQTSRALARLRLSPQLDVVQRDGEHEHL